jgi:4-diphosphocytidyl-2-C-methyl-D-erythritol kinase
VRSKPIKAGQHRHGQDLRAAALHRLLRGLQHLEPAARVYRDVTHVERHGGLHRVRDGLRNVMPFLVEENLDALRPQRLDDRRPLAREELVAHLEQAQVRLQHPHQGQRLIRAIHVQRKNQFVGRSHFNVRIELVKQVAPAKINLYLHIRGRRPDGFHELETLMALISVHDTLDIDLLPAGAGIEFSCSDPALAGGSSDAATVLRVLNILTGLHAPAAKLAELAARLGSDIPFFLHPPTAICRGRGEMIEPVRLTEDLFGVLVHPGFGVSTPWCYKTYAQNPVEGAPGRTFTDFTLRNDLEPPAFSKYPWLPAVKAWFQKQPDVRDALMSGSGSSVFALTETPEARGKLAVRFRAEFGETLFAEMFSLAPAAI